MTLIKSTDSEMLKNMYDMQGFILYFTIFGLIAVIAAETKCVLVKKDIEQMEQIMQSKAVRVLDRPQTGWYIFEPF